MTIQDQFGNIDIYLFDQLLRGRIASASAAAGRHGEPGYRIFDAGCGGGRNLVYLLRSGYEVCGNDADAAAIAQVRALAETLAAGKPHDFRVEPIEQTSFPDQHADVVMASAVLHFARDDEQFEGMLRQLWRVLKHGGVFFARLASTIGIEADLQRLGQGAARGAGRYRLPDGSDRYLVDAETIAAWTTRLGGALIDPIKTTVVHEQRAMTTWVARK